MDFKKIIKVNGLLGFLFLSLSFATCKYSTKDTAPIPPEITTFRVNYFQNKARYVNPQITPKLTESVKQKIIGQTRLRQVNESDAHYDISGYLSNYSVTTSGVSGNKAGQNRLNVTFHLIFKNSLDAKKNFEADLTSNYDFGANLTLQSAESLLQEDIIKNISDAVFNRIFSNW